MKFFSRLPTFEKLATLKKRKIFIFLNILCKKDEESLFPKLKGKPCIPIYILFLMTGLAGK
jgi:hypothetical protein